MLSQSIKTIKGIGSKKAEFFANLGVFTLLDLMSLYPFRYQDLSQAKMIKDIQNEEEAVFLARVFSLESSRSQKGKNILRVNLNDNNNTIQAIFVNSPYMSKLLKKGELYWFYGKCQSYGKYKSVFHPEFALFSENPAGMGIKSIYPLSQDLKQKDVKNAMTSCQNLFELVPENLPKTIIDDFSLLPKSKAMYLMHFADNMEDIEKAKYRLKFEEIYLQQKQIFEARQKQKEQTRQHFYEDVAIEELYSLFNFELTNSQKQTIIEIKNDLKNETLMNRLIFGDVGSGKTAVAIVSSYIAFKSNYQSCIMAPTEVLAKQHYDEFKKILGDKASISLLVSSVKNKNKILDNLQNGSCDIVIGTHAIIEDTVEFNNLSMVITDEQHRFGVKQRSALKNKAPNGADILSMSATPIPRTLSMVYYGDLDISYLLDMPKGRKEVITKYVAGVDDKRKLIKFIYDRLNEGEQAYFLAPRIEDNDEKTKTSVEKMYQYFKEVYPNFQIEYLHGKINPIEKNRIMESFKEGKTQILIATTVIEVGVNVPNATIMLISSIENFGLSQLHQLRGRVGRGNKQSYCFLTANKITDTVLQRVDAMQDYHSGFDIAEIDLKMRGPGEIVGNRQHGFKKFKLVDYEKDYELIMKIHQLFI